MPLMLILSSYSLVSSSYSVKRILSLFVFVGLKVFDISVFILVYGIALANSGSVSILTLRKPSGFAPSISACAKKLLSNYLLAGIFGKPLASSVL